MANPHISLFLGAGASAFFDFPTTKTFINDLRQHLGTVEVDLLNSILAINGFYDAEHVLELLNALDAVNRYPADSFFRKYNPTITLPNRGNLPFIDVLGALSNLRNKLIDDIYRQYEFRENKVDDICKVYSPLIELLFFLNQTSVVSVFTTNYDRVIEKMCYKKNIFVTDGFVRNGETEKHELNPEEYEWYPDVV